MKKINLGCGKVYKKGYINVDITGHCDKRVDLNKFPYPFNTGEYDYVLMDNILEHVNNPFKTLEEVSRILKKTGKAEIIVPHFLGNPMAIPEHKREFGIQYFGYLCSEDKSFKQYKGHSKSLFRKIEYKRIIFDKGRHPITWINYLIEPIANINHVYFENNFPRIFVPSSMKVILIK